MYILCIYKKNIILSLFKIGTLNFTMYILTILTCPLKAYVIGLYVTGLYIRHNLISMSIFFNIFFFFFIILKRRRKTNKLRSKRIPGSSCSLMFFKIDVPKNFAICTGKHLCWSLFSINLQA